MSISLSVPDADDCVDTVLQYHYANLEALALSLDAPEAIDQTLPQTEAIAEVGDPGSGFSI